MVEEKLIGQWLFLKWWPSRYFQQISYLESLKNPIIFFTFFHINQNVLGIMFLYPYLLRTLYHDRKICGKIKKPQIAYRPMFAQSNGSLSFFPVRNLKINKNYPLFIQEIISLAFKGFELHYFSILNPLCLYFFLPFSQHHSIFSLW